MTQPTDDNLWLWQGKKPNSKKTSIADLLYETTEKHKWVLFILLVLFIVLTVVFFTTTLLALHATPRKAEAQTEPKQQEAIPNPPAPPKPETLRELPQPNLKPINTTEPDIIKEITNPNPKPELSAKMIEDARALNEMLEWWKQQKQTQVQATATRPEQPFHPERKPKPRHKQQYQQVEPEVNHMGCPPSLCFPKREEATIGNN